MYRAECGQGMTNRDDKTTERTRERERNRTHQLGVRVASYVRYLRGALDMYAFGFVAPIRFVLISGACKAWLHMTWWRIKWNRMEQVACHELWAGREVENLTGSSSIPQQRNERINRMTYSATRRERGALAERAATCPTCPTRSGNLE